MSMKHTGAETAGRGRLVLSDSGRMQHDRSGAGPVSWGHG